ncbi:MAG: acetyltransferase [Xanthobacteraceae bacterium]|jgi:GNAT superfamily N-acetyltransferase|nr:acetyltransferase [Xanthobacteraceae bacterium]
MAADGVNIRAVGEAERAAWEPLWKGYQTFYKVSLSDEVNTVTWQRLHDPAEPMGVLGAYLDGRLVGIAHWIEHRSCWTIGNYVYLQDLFVESQARGHGIGRALIEAVCDVARAAGASRVHWLTHESNTDARALYDKVAERPGFIQYRKLF